MRTLFNNRELSYELLSCAFKFSIVPFLYIVPVFVFQIEVDSIYDYLLEVTRLYSVILLTSLLGKLVNSKMIRFGLILAIINGVYDSVTEIVILQQMLVSPFPFVDALLDEALLIAGYGCIISGLYQHFMQINRLTLTDNLTQCYTRSALNLIPIGGYQLFYFDLDDFKIINDTRGHNVGDKVLTTFSRMLIRSCDDTGYAFRLGGDEFLAIVDVDKAVHFIDVFTKACDLEEIKVSYGTSACFDNNFKIAISEADENLYEMKQCKKSFSDQSFESDY
ncbi:GGDEF domain-containing protein [Vibrio sinensis]|uniref:diguanylate cyclase n=1 Tax=Vibrio sinensis TaxID=2302434 RepID=A0A3A6RFV7_9VIBR|nr:GGDEF domain-containing protein [Vibrio sinensis]RJX75591.1 GGDEF domain-containing protein [Vibrio sinensis]